MTTEISVQFTLKLDKDNIELRFPSDSLLYNKIIYEFDIEVLGKLPPSVSLCWHMSIYNDSIFSWDYGGIFFVAEKDLTLDEVKAFMEGYFEGLIGGSAYEIMCKSFPILNDYDLDTTFYLRPFTFDLEPYSHDDYDHLYLKEVKLVSAQKGNSFYHEEEVIEDLATWQPEDPLDFELYLCYHLVFRDGTVQPMYKTWATKNRVLASYQRYMAETGKRIIQMYPHKTSKSYDTAFFEKSLKDLDLIVAKSKEEAILKFRTMLFEFSNFKEEYFSKKIGTLTEYTYQFNGKVEIIDKRVPIVKEGG